MNQIMACIDGSAQAAAVCDCAAWASLQLDAPLTLLHVLDQQQYPAAGNLSGIIGLGSREYLLEELAALDEKRSKLALEEGRMMLDSARQRVITAGIAQPDVRQRHGDAKAHGAAQAQVHLQQVGFRRAQRVPLAGDRPYVADNDGVLGHHAGERAQRVVALHLIVSPVISTATGRCQLMVEPCASMIAGEISPILLTTTWWMWSTSSSGSVVSL